MYITWQAYCYKWIMIMMVNTVYSRLWTTTTIWHSLCFDFIRGEDEIKKYTVIEQNLVGRWMGGIWNGRWDLNSSHILPVPRWRSQRVGNSWSRSSTQSAVSLASASWSQLSSIVSRTSLTAVQSRHNSGNKGRALWRDTRTCICSNVGWWPAITNIL